MLRIPALAVAWLAIACGGSIRTPATAAAAATPPPSPPAGSERTRTTTFELSGNELVVPGPVLFETGSDRLLPESDAVLYVVADYLEAKSYITLLRIEGHTGSDGPEAENQDRSEKHALAVARWLVAHGVDCARLIPTGFGRDKPIASNETPEGKAQNRRISFVNAALRGRAIGGMPADGGGVVAGDPCP